MPRRAKYKIEHESLSGVVTGKDGLVVARYFIAPSSGGNAFRLRYAQYGEGGESSQLHELERKSFESAVKEVELLAKEQWAADNKKV